MAKTATKPMSRAAKSAAKPASTSPGAPQAPGNPARGRGRRATRAERSAERRQAILAAALQEFSARGYAATRLDDVARRAKVAKGTIYLYFADKETLFQELIRAEISPVVAGIEATAHADVPLRIFAEGMIEVFVREIFGTHRKDVIRLVIAEGPRFPKLAEFYYREIIAHVETAIRAMLQRAFERGELASDTLVRFPQLLVAPGIVAIIWNGLFDRFEPLDVRALMRAHFDLVLGERRAA
jgi:AcrR family transcriptional regulator